MSAESSTSHIVQALAVNFALTIAKAIAAVYTGSGALLAETLHTLADCGNELLLLLGVKRARQKPDAAHPLGYGRALYFWSFMVAVMLFLGGGVFSVYEGVHKLMEPEPVQRVGVGIGILALALALEGASTIANVREINKRRGSMPFTRYLRDTKDSDLIVVFGENAAASLGAVVAIGALSAAYVTHDGRWDAAGSVGIGVILLGVAVFLAVEVKSLLLGESASPEVAAAAREVIADHPKLTGIINLITVQQGPGEVLVAAKVSLAPNLTSRQVCEVINAFEVDLKKRCPEVRWSFVEPDFDDAEDLPKTA